MSYHGPRDEPYFASVLRIHRAYGRAVAERKRIGPQTPRFRRDLDYARYNARFDRRVNGGYSMRRWMLR